ncbi:hypothetical protein R3I94_011301 [Phoxinus phoxinus]
MTTSVTSTTSTVHRRKEITLERHEKAVSSYHQMSSHGRWIRWSGEELPVSRCDTAPACYKAEHLCGWPGECIRQHRNTRLSVMQPTENIMWTTKVVSKSESMFWSGSDW